MGKWLRIAGTAELGTRGMPVRDSALRTLLKVAQTGSLRRFLLEVAFLDRRAADAARRSAGAWKNADCPICTQHRTWLNRLGHVVRLCTCGGRRHRRKDPAIDLDGLTLERYARRQ